MADAAVEPVAPAEPAPSAETAEPTVAAEPAELVAEPVLVERTVAAEIARYLHAAGARFCFTVPAEPILPLLDELALVGIRVVTVRHEGGAAFMAEALTQSTGRPQIVAVSRAVGASNAAVGIHAAHQDSVPMVVLVGQVRTEFAGREAFQESDLVGGIGSLARWATQIDRPGDTRTQLDRAWRRLNEGRPGPVVLSIPIDVQSARIEVPDGEPPKPPGARGAAADRPAVSRALKLLAASERGVIVAGGGVLRARATKRLVALSEALAIPVIAAWRRPDVFPNDHVNYLGMTGPWTASTVQQRLADADVIMFVGTRLSQMNTADYTIPGPDVRWIHVDIEPRVAHAGLSGPTLSISADASRFLDSAWSDLRAAALDNEMRSRREARNVADREAYKAAADVSAGAWNGPGVHPGKLMAALRAALPDNATIATDAGNLAAFVARGYSFRRAGTFLGATSGAMGFGFPAAVAASLLDPDRISVALCGDGGFAASMVELETAVREGAHPIAIVLDNERYGTISMQQEIEGRPTGSTDLGPIDFAAAARAYGALGLSVSDDASFSAALREAITSRRPAVIHVRVDRSWRSVDDNPAQGR
jgi:acetolactate synthase-1/2/3 large subunit